MPAKVKTRQLIYINPFGTNTSSAEAIFDSWLKVAKTRKEYNFIKWTYDLVEHSIQSDPFNCDVFILFAFSLRNISIMFTITPSIRALQTC